jgi:hypothetical protein
MAKNARAFSSDGIFKLIQRWERYITALGDNVEKSNNISAE